MKMNVPERLRAWRTERGLTQSQAADLVGVGQPAWSEYESIEGGPRGIDAAVAHGIVSVTAGSPHEVTLAMLAELCKRRRAGKVAKHSKTAHRHRDNGPAKRSRKPPKRSARRGAP